MGYDLKQMGRIGVLMGGCSSEREISLKSGHAVAAALGQGGADVVEIVLESFEARRNQEAIAEKRINIAFIALHGVYGEDGQVQALLEAMGIPYVGSGVEASRMAIDKIRTQEALRRASVPVAEFQVVGQGDPASIEAARAMAARGPVVIKPACEGSSIGVTIVRSIEELDRALAVGFEYGPRLLVERYIHGRELTVGILGEEVLPIIEIRPHEGFFDFTSKYQKGMTDYLLPAPLTDEAVRKVQGVARETFRVIGCRDMGRVDVMLDDLGRPYVLEINTIPGFTETSLLPKAARAVGYDFVELCARLVSLAHARATGRVTAHRG